MKHVHFVLKDEPNMTTINNTLGHKFLLIFRIDDSCSGSDARTHLNNIAN